jgi:hypothetical protein
MPYAAQIKKVLPRDLRGLFSKLNSPTKIQDYVDTLPTNFELSGETCHPPINVVRENVAHCFEAAVFAAAVLAYHGQRPLIIDLATAYDDEDHAIALFKRGKYWGAISKTNHSILKFRDPLYHTPRELAMSYFHEYYLDDGRKSLRAYSAPFDLTRYAPEKWLLGESLEWLLVAIAKSRYFPVVPDNFERHLRRASHLELQALKVVAVVDPRNKRG